LSLHDLGETGGSETVSLLESEIPSHVHTMGAQSVPLGGVAEPAAATFSRPASGNLYLTSATSLVSMNETAIAPAGGDQPHNNMQPYLTFYFNIALQGVFPPRG
jgi:microcystin-dependent protein